MSFKNIFNIILKKKNLKSTNTNHRQYMRWRRRRCRRLLLQIGGRVKKAKVMEAGTKVAEAGVEVVQRMKNCHSVSARKSCTESSSFARIYYVHCCLSLSCCSYSSMYLLLASSSCLCTDSFSAWTWSWMNSRSVPAGPAPDTEPRKYNLL